MTEDDYDIFVNKVAAVLEVKGKQLTEVAIGVWWTGLSTYDLATVADAIDRFVRSGDNIYAFTPNHIVQLIEGGTVDASQDAWAKVNYAVRCAGPWADVVFEDPIIHRVIEDMGGWPGFGLKTDQEWPFVMKEFETRYRGYKVRANLDTYLPRLTGMANTHNNDGGYARQDPVLIGDLHKVAAVMSGSAGKPKIGFVRAGSDLMALLPQLVKKSPDEAPKLSRNREIPLIQQGKLLA